MTIEKVTGSRINDYLAFIPSEIYPEIEKNRCSVTGALLFEKPCGAAVWSAAQGDGTGRLLSLYVDPPCRRIGAGKLLLDSVKAEMADKKVSEIGFSFALTGDRCMFVPFFEDVDVATEYTRYPFGIKTLSKTVKALENKGINQTAPVGKAVNDLNREEKNRLSGWLYENFGQDLSLYMGDDPSSFAFIDGGKVKAALFLSKEDEETLSLDYVYNDGSDPKTLMGLFRTACDKLSDKYKGTTMIEMMLASDESEHLFKGLFGDPEGFMDVCSGMIS